MPRSVIYVVVVVCSFMAGWNAVGGGYASAALLMFCAVVWASMLRKQRD